MTDDKEHQWHDFPPMPRLTVLPWIVWGIGIVLLVFGLAYAKKSHAEPIARAVVNNGQVVITVHTEDCTLKDNVANLPKRATWVEGNKTFEGCVGVSPVGVAMFYFKEDKSVAVVPLEMFQPVTGA